MNSHNNSIYISTSCLPGNISLKERVSDYRKKGFDAIELGHGISMNNEDEKYLFSNPGRYLIHNYFPPPKIPFVLNLASDKQIILEKSFDLIKTALFLSKKIHAPLYSLHAGFIRDPVGFGVSSFVFPSVEDEEEKKLATQRFEKNLKLIAQSSNELGVDICIENNCCTTDMVNKLLLQTTEEFQHFFHSQLSDNLGILLDTGHLNITAHTFNFDPMNFIDALSDHIRVIHLHDNDGIQDLHVPVNTDSWVMDILHLSQFAELPIIIEARFQNVDELQKHVIFLNNELGRD